MYESSRATPCNLSNRPLRRKLRLGAIRQFVPGHSRAPAPWTRSCRPRLSVSCSSGARLLHPGDGSHNVCFSFSFSIGVESLYNIMLVSAAPQCESALCKAHRVLPEPPTPLQRPQVSTGPQAELPLSLGCFPPSVCLTLGSVYTSMLLYLSCHLLPLLGPHVCSLRQHPYSCLVDRFIRTAFLDSTYMH